MGLFQKHVGIDFIDTALHVFITMVVAYIGADVLSPASMDDGPVLGLVFGGSAALFAWRRNRARAEEPAPPETTGEAAARRAGELEARVAELELGQQHMLELEERLDFAERLLARRHEAARLGSEEG